MKLSLAAKALAVAGLCSISSVANADIRVFAGVGYDSITVKADEDDADQDDRESSGLSYQLLGQYDVFGPLPGLDVFVGGGLRGQSLTYEDGPLTLTWTAQLATGEAGVNVGLIPLVTLQAALGYDYGISGETEAEITGQGSSTADTDSYSRMRLAGRAFFTPLPLFRVGAEVSFYPVGSYTADAEGAKAHDLSGWGAMVTGGIAL